MVCVGGNPSPQPSRGSRAKQGRMDSPEHDAYGAARNTDTGLRRCQQCAACGQPIVDRYIMRVADDSWHEGCLTCAVCRTHLSRTCYARDAKLYCKADYDKLFAVKCSGCAMPVAPHELVMRALDHVFHVPCFVCVACGRPLQKGDQFVVRGGGRLYCRPDFEKEMALVHISIGGRGENGQQLTAQPRQDGRRGPKRPRTILTTAQRRAFKASFEISQKPCRKVRESLAKETGLSVRIVQVWFQNQRAKLKKLQRKQQQQQLQQQGQKTEQNGGSANTDLSSPGKDGKKSDELSHGDPADYCSYYSSSSHPDGGGVYLKSDLSLDSEEGSLVGLEEALVGGGGGVTGADGAHLFAPPAVNPIDKLYSMQTSYFSASECECLGATN